MVHNAPNIAQSDIIRVHPRSRETHLYLDDLRSAKLQNLGLSAIGHAVEHQEYEIYRNQRTDHQVIYTLSGKGWLRIDNKKHEINPGSLLITPHGHSQHYGLESDSWEIMWFAFQHDSAWWKSGACSNHFGIFPSVWGPSLKSAVHGLYHESHSAHFGTTELREAFAQEISIYLERELHPLHESTAISIQQKKLSDIIHAIQSDLTAPWTVESLADTSALHVCPDHFSRLCKETLGKRPMQLVTDIRMRKAAELLRCSDYKLELLSQLVGYGSPYSLSIAFKRHFGISPNHYRHKKSAGYVA